MALLIGAALLAARLKSRVLAFAGAVVAVLIGIALLTAYLGHTPEAPATGNAKSACLYSVNSVSELERIGAQIGRPFRCASVYDYGAATWSDWVSPWFTSNPPPDSQWAHWVQAAPGARRLIIGQAMIPSGQMPSNWRALGAVGAYDGYIRTLGRNLVQAGLGSSVIDLGPEANGTWNVDNAGQTDVDFSQWRTYWARFARVMKSVPGADFTFDWDLNSAVRSIPLAKIYPGDQAVDLIGVDVYDTATPALPAAPSPSRWQAIAAQPGGVLAILAFAKRHAKPFSVPEWGLVSFAGKGGGDDPTFVASIAALVRNNTVAFQSYFDHPGIGGTLAIQKNPRAFAIYKKSFGGP